MKYVRATKLAKMTGLSVAAINARRHQGKWLKGIHWFKNSERIIWYSVPAIERSIKIQSI